jgi:hypothetical protein
MSWFLVLIFFAMCFCHIVDDYYLQGILASMKQKNWWTKQESYEDKKNSINILFNIFYYAFLSYCR